MPLHAWSSARYTFPLPEGHRFPIAKYALLRERVLAEGIVPPEAMHDPARVARDDLLLVHTADYIDRFTNGHLTADEERRLGFPWSESLVERSYRAAGGTSAAARAALEHGIAMNLAGGTHHAFPGHGEGFCVFNDVAVAIRALQRDRRIERALVVDLDVHQGNGTHAVFVGDDSVFTFSMHGDRNYPFRKIPAADIDTSPDVRRSTDATRNYALNIPGDLDVPLPAGTTDDEYLSRLEDALPFVIRSSQPDMVFYLAGADPHEGDRLGTLKLTFDGLARRDYMVISACREIGVPIAICIAGGYGRNVDDVVAIHLRTARIASSFAQ